MNYTTFSHDFPPFHGISHSYTDIQLPYKVSKKSDKKILFVLDYMPQEDIQSGRLLSGATGDVLAMLLERVSLLKHSKDDYSWLAVTFNAFRTAGRNADFNQELAHTLFAKRVSRLIVKYKPTMVVIFGDLATKWILPHRVAITKAKKNSGCSAWHGTIMKEVFSDGGKEHTTLVSTNLSLNPVSRAQSSACNLIGYMIDRLSYAVAHRNTYAVDEQRLLNHKPVFINTIAKFDNLMAMLKKQEVVAVDTEAVSLAKITNRILSIQFAKCVDYGYFVPLYHKDTPFTSSELTYIIGVLSDFFAGDNDNEEHVYVNGNFDLTLLRFQLNNTFFYNKVYDIFGGEYAHDENAKYLKNVTGDYYYSLANISVQYGFMGYTTAAFSKENRHNIATTDLSKDLIYYGTLDVVVPLAIREKQLQRAKDVGHKHYHTLVSEQLSDLIHGFSVMSYHGSPLDVDYLYYLSLPTSPIKTLIADMQQKFLASDAVAVANRRLLDGKGLPIEGLFGVFTSNVFSLRTDAHKKLLFFDVLGLKPLGFGKSGGGQLNIAFQQHYKDVPEVKMFTDYSKAKTLDNVFVKSMIQLLGKDPDLQKDRRVRANYHYLTVVTGRTSCTDPNLQQIPSHSELSKHIKRLFIAPKGTLWIKVDYRVHEVRGWGIISFDKGIAALFKKAKAIRDEYRQRPTPELKARLKAEADVHVMNAMYFYRKTVDEITKPLRDSIKGIIFGLIYQMAITTLSKKLGMSLEATENLVHEFNKRFPNGMKWIEKTKKFAREHYFYENPIGFRRHLYGYLLPNSVNDSRRIHSDMDRRAVNSPIQGMGAQFIAIGARALDKAVNRIRLSGRKIDLQICNSVHDSLEIAVGYSNLLESISIIETALTTDVSKEMQRRYGFNFVVDLEIDFSIGANMADCYEWDTSLESLKKYVHDSLVFQRDTLGHDVNVGKTMRNIFVRQLEHMDTTPAWLKEQAHNTNFKL